MNIDYKAIESKYSKLWEELRIHEPEVMQRSCTMITTPPLCTIGKNAISDLRCAIIADVQARFLRMQGINVLFVSPPPQTGVLKSLNNKSTSNEDDNLKEQYLDAQHRYEAFERLMHSLGISIDMRRIHSPTDSLYTTAVNWHIDSLNQKKLIKKSTVALPWCAEHNTLVSMYDLKTSEEIFISETTLHLFKDMHSNCNFLCTDQQSNNDKVVAAIGIDPSKSYILIDMGALAYVSRESVGALSYQLKFNILNEINGMELLGKRAINPYTNTHVNIIEAAQLTYGTDLVLIRSENIKESDDIKVKTIPFYTIDKKLRCVCESQIIVKMQEDHNILDLDNYDAAQDAKEKLKKINVLPNALHEVFNNTLNTPHRLPIDREHSVGIKSIISNWCSITPPAEAFTSSSFMTFYNILSNSHVSSTQLKAEFFDHVLSSKGTIPDTSKITGIPELIIKNSKMAFEYWHSNLVFHMPRVHLTSYGAIHLLQMHAVYPEAFCPKNIVISESMEFTKEGVAVLDLLKMYNIILEYGSDIIRASTLLHAGVQNKIVIGNDAILRSTALVDRLYSCVLEVKNFESKELQQIDFWLYSKINARIQKITSLMGNMELKEVLIELTQLTLEDFSYYKQRSGNNSLVITDFLLSTVKMLFPLLPFTAEELWSLLGNDSSIAKEQWPAYDSSMKDSSMLFMEDALNSSIKLLKNINTHKEDAHVYNNCMHILISKMDLDFQLINPTFGFGSYFEGSQEKNMSVDMLADYFSQCTNDIKTISGINNIKIERINSKDQYGIPVPGFEFISIKI